MTTHGCTKNRKPTSEYQTWGGFRNRCYNPNNPAYKDYGARGISVCARWDRFENFLEDMGKRPKGLALDRRDNDGDYSPDNCRWATVLVNNRNRRQPSHFLAGLRFGRLTALHSMEKRFNGGLVWLCRCECGALKNITAKGLRAGASRSCGCLHRDVAKLHFARRTGASEQLLAVNL